MARSFLVPITPSYFKGFTEHMQELESYSINEKFAISQRCSTKYCLVAVSYGRGLQSWASQVAAQPFLFFFVLCLWHKPFQLCVDTSRHTIFLTQILCSSLSFKLPNSMVGSSSSHS